MRELRRKSKAPARERPDEKQMVKTDGEKQGLNAAHEEMLVWLKKVKFRKAMLNGVEERDVWKKLEELNNLYEAAILSERTRYDTLLQAYVKTTNTQINGHKKENQVLKSKIAELEKQLGKSEKL